ncbi:hypothetical protein FXO37_23146 [Capsicum annuum]|nr:hypothetical protein FXO37_23146 [Capsicum annuum]
MHNGKITVPTDHTSIAAGTIVQLGFNGFTDIVKQESAKCFSSSQILELQHNEIHGEFPLILTNNSVLTSLDVSWNLFSGKIPSVIGNLWSLQKLRMINNSLEGDLRSLKTLSLGRNQFSNFIPSSFRKLTDLESMSLGGNGLNESLPDGVMSLSNLSILNLSRNKFSGTIPSSIGTLYKLTVVDLSGQNFSEEIPFDLAVSPDLDNCSTLVNLDLHSNSLSGQISVDLRHLSHLSVLDLGRNNLMGKVPIDISNYSSLTSFVLNLNHLSRNIPESLSSQSSAARIGWLGKIGGRVSVANNFLTGRIPEFICKASYLQVLDLSNNALSGKILLCVLNYSPTLGVVNLGNDRLYRVIPDSFSVGCALRTLDLKDGGEGGKGLLAGKTTAAAANEEKDKKRPISRSSRAGLQLKRKGSGAGAGGCQIWALGNDNRLAMMAIGSQVPTKREKGRKDDAPKMGRKRSIAGDNGFPGGSGIKGWVWERLTSAGRLVADFNGF